MSYKIIQKILFDLKQFDFFISKQIFIEENKKEIEKLRKQIKLKKDKMLYK